MTEAALGLADIGLFSGAPQHENFCRFKDFFPAAPMAPSSEPFHFPTGSVITMPESYDYNGEAKPFEAFFERGDTAALLVLKDGLVRYERYALTGHRNAQWISMSVAKSFISALVGIAVDEGLVNDVEEPISQYVQVAPGSAYDGVSIRNVLQMSSGARWNEDYNDPTSDIHRISAALAPGGSLNHFVATMVPESEPGTVCRYNSGDTQALGALLIAATGQSISSYMQAKLGQPLGMTDTSYWVTDSEGTEMAYAGLNMTAHDFARLGELYRNGGQWRGAQIVSEAWVNASVRADAPHLQVGQPILADHTLPLGYGYQWWLPDGDWGEFSAIGVYNQFVYVDPSRGVTIVKLSANRSYGTTMYEETNLEVETIAFLRSIAQRFD